MLGWLVVTHLLAAVAVGALPLAGPGRGLLLAAIAAHGYWRRPRPSGPIVRNRNGTWSVPELGLTALRLVPATRYADWWVELRLRGPGHRLRILLCRDQLGAQSWRELQAMLRCDNGARGLP